MRRPRKAKELSLLEVRRLAQPGRWSVGGVDGLALQVTGTRARSWVLRVAVAGKQREMGLGNFPLCRWLMPGKRLDDTGVRYEKAATRYQYAGPR